MDDTTRNKIHEFWDYLSDQPASQFQYSQQALLEFIADHIEAQHGYWLGVIRQSEWSHQDPMQGWVPGMLKYLHDHPIEVKGASKLFKKGIRDSVRGVVNESSVNHARQAGSFRSTLLKDHVSKEFFDSEMFDFFYRQRGFIDSLFVVMPVDETSESYHCFMRAEGHSFFTEDELEFASYALRGVKWFHRQMMLGFGLLGTGKALTPVERNILSLLLTGLSEAEIAEEMHQSKTTTHKYVTGLYRKFGIKGRAGLASLWLGHDR